MNKEEDSLYTKAMRHRLIKRNYNMVALQEMSEEELENLYKEEYGYNAVLSLRAEVRMFFVIFMPILNRRID